MKNIDLMLFWCWPSVSAQHQNTIGWPSRVCWLILIRCVAVPADIRSQVRSLGREIRIRAQYHDQGPGHHDTGNINEIKWMGCRPLCTQRLNWAKRTSWGWWDERDDSSFQPQDSKLELWRSASENVTSGSRRHQQYWISTKRHFCFFKTWRPEWGLNPRSPSF